MSTSNKQDFENQEIDLGHISTKIGDFFKSIANRFFNLVLFVKRNIVWISIIFIVGAILGFILDKKTKVYNHEVIVLCNFSAIDYVNSKINLIEAKRKEGDTVFLKDLGFKNTKKLGEIEIEPIIEPYKFIDGNERNFKLIELMAEDGNLEKILTDKLTSKNYPFHRIKFSTNYKTSEEATVNPLLNFLNDSKYFKDIQKVYNNNILVKINENDSIINQINGLLNQFSKTTSGTKNANLVYYNENTQLNEVIKTKENLIAENGRLKLELVNVDKIVKEQSSVLNNRDKTGLNNKLKYLFPIVFVLLFILISSFIKTYKQKTQNL